MIREERGLLREALMRYTKAIEIRPGYTEAIRRRAKVYMKLGMEREAEEDIEKVNELKRAE
jgi:hypothetical protein